MTPSVEIAAGLASLGFGGAIVAILSVLEMPMRKKKLGHADQAQDDTPHTSIAWADKTDRHPIDNDLRICGWQILHHHDDGTRIWENAMGQEATRDEAVAITLRYHGFELTDEWEEGEQLWCKHGVPLRASYALYTIAADIQCAK